MKYIKHRFALVFPLQILVACGLRPYQFYTFDVSSEPDVSTIDLFDTTDVPDIFDAVDTFDVVDVPLCDGGNCQVVPTQIALGRYHACARASDSTVRCWGNNNFGQLGYTTTTLCLNTSPCSMSARLIPALTGVAQVVAGSNHTCARMTDGTVRCWGSDVFGQLGGSSVAIPITGLAEVTQISTRDDHTCALRQDGSVVCWGINDFGQLGGNGTDVCSGTPCSRTPIVVDGITGATTISAGRQFTCAVMGDTTIRCWGNSDSGRLAGSSTMSGIQGLTGVTHLSLGTAHACVRLMDGSVQCWGANFLGQLGDGTMMSRTIPVPVAGLFGVADIGLGSAHSCARLTDGTVRCWGSDNRGERGGATATMSVSGLTTVSEVVAGDSFTCARLVDGALSCCGANNSGQLGDTTTTDRSTFAAVNW